MTVQLSDRVQRSFSRSFQSYHDTACQQAWVAQKLVEEMRRHGAPTKFERGFELGCGTGHFTRLLCQAHCFEGLTLNDIAPEARQTADELGAQFICGDARRVIWPENADLFASASMIQWMEDPRALLERAARSLAPGGWLVIAGFGPQQYRELSQIGTSARAPGLCDPDQMAAAVRAHLEVLSTGEALRPSYFATPHHVLRHLRKTGVNGRAKSVWTKSTLALFEAEYTRRFQTENGVSLSYHPVWIVARKPQV